MGPVIPALVSQFRPPLPETNHNIRKGDSTEKKEDGHTQEKVQASHS